MFSSSSNWIRAIWCLDYNFEAVCGRKFPVSGSKATEVEEENQMFKAWTEELGFGGMNPEAWKDDKRLHMIMAVLIGTCVALEELTMSVDFLLHNEFYPAMVKYAVGAGLLSKLKKIRVTAEYDEETEFWGPEFAEVQNVLLLLFYLPGVESLEIAACTKMREEGGRIDRLEENLGEEFWPAWPAERRPVAENLTTLRLVRSSIDPATIERLLQQTPHLKVFEFDCFMYPDHVPLDLDGLREALLHIRATLTSLTVRYGLYHNEDLDIIAQDTFGTVAGSLGPLHDFPILSTLVISLPVLFGNSSIDPGPHPTLSAYLPPALEHLTITDDLYRYGEFQEDFEDENAMAFFRAYLSGEKMGPKWMSMSKTYLWGQNNWSKGKCYRYIDWVQDREPEWKLKTPGLESFTYDLRKRGEETRGYWDRREARKQLLLVCEQQGVGGEVLWA
jgi:hypothetical protein